MHTQENILERIIRIKIAEMLYTAKMVPDYIYIVLDKFLHDN